MVGVRNYEEGLWEMLVACHLPLHLPFGVVSDVGMVIGRGEIHSLPLVPLPRGLRRTSGFTKCFELRFIPD